MSRYAVAKTFTPLLNTASFSQVFGGEDGSLLPLDEQGLLRAVEMVAFPETRFTILQEINSTILQVETKEYPSSPLFVDSRFLHYTDQKKQERKKRVLPPSKIVKDLEALVGTAYIWGGNYHLGVKELLTYYPPASPISNEMERIWSLQGVDCTGLLYQVTEGAVPRNSSWLTAFGVPLFIENLSPQEIASLVKPLDLIVWHGHLIIILDSQKCIESTPKEGVVIKNLIHRLEQLIDELKKIPMNNPPESKKDYFVLRRWL